MVNSTEASKCLEDLLKSAFLPKLKEDLDSVPIQKEHFVEYEKALNIQLPLIFDLVQQQKTILYKNTKLHSLLILLCCELTAPKAVYRLNNKHLLKNAIRLLKDCRELGSEVDDHILTYYQTRLKKDEWKRQLGAVHGFEQYLQFFYNENIRTKKTINSFWLSFCLSVALTVRDCHESRYKHLGIRVFLILLQHAQPEDMRNLNIHSVIYDSVFKDVHFMDSVPATEDIWNCLYLCLDFLIDIDSFNWSQVDDLLEILIRNVPLASNNSVSICLLNFVPKLCAYFTLNRNEIMLKCWDNIEELESMNEVCECCAGNSSYCCFRWVKSILDLIEFESYKLMQGIDTCLELLAAMTRCYMICILSIPIQVTEPHLIQFYDKFTAVLMKVIVTHKQRKDVIKLIKVFIEVFLWQLQHSTYVEQSSRLTTFRQAFKQLMEHTVFVNIL